MATITLRDTKGSPLTFVEMDANLTNLNNDKLEVINNLNVASAMDVATDFIAMYDTSTGENRKILAGATTFANRTLIIKVIADTLPTYVGDGISRIVLPSNFDGLKLREIGGHVYAAGVGSTTNVQIHNQSKGVDMLSTLLTIDAGENDSSTAATPAVINGSANTVNTANVIRFDIDQIGSTTAANGLELRLGFGI